MGRRGRGYWDGHQHGRVPMEPYDIDQHIAAMSESGLTLYAYCQQRGVDRRSLGEGIKEHRPDVYDRFVGPGGEEKGAAAGRKLETSAKGRLERRGYYVMKSFASKSPVDMLAVGLDRPNLMVQAKKAGTLGVAEWNAIFDLAEAHGCLPVLVSRPPDDPKGVVWARLLRRREPRERQKGLLAPFDPANPYQPQLAAEPELALA